MKLIPLHIAMDYPVNWDFERILRDLVQNFYDAVGCEHFKEEFFCATQINHLGNYDIEMKTYGHPFSYEWLTYIGGSTKTTSPGDYVGMYGEGFKICMLCIVRMATLGVSMESQTWKIKPCRYTEEIEDKNIDMLGYELEEREDDGWTRLLLFNVPSYYACHIDETLLNFFYPQNQLFGKKLYETDNYSIYERSNVPIPYHRLGGRDFKGILYCNFLARGRLPFEIILLVRKDMRNSDMRKREVLEKTEVRSLLLRLSREIDSTASYIMLEKMSAFWGDIPNKMVDFNTWYYVICILVRNVCKDELLVKKFMATYKGLVYIERKTMDGVRNRLIEQTERWYDKRNDKKLVAPIFRFLGAKSLVEDYERELLSSFELPNEEEKICTKMLFRALKQMFPYLLYDEEPEVVIQKDTKKNYQSLMFAERIYAKKRTDKRRYKINKVIMSHEDFEIGKFYDTLVKFVDILIHAYGTNRNARVNVYLTYFGAACIRHRVFLKKCEEVWDARTGNYLDWMG